MRAVGAWTAVWRARGTLSPASSEIPSVHAANRELATSLMLPKVLMNYSFLYSTKVLFRSVPDEAGMHDSMRRAY